MQRSDDGAVREWKRSFPIGLDRDVVAQNGCETVEVTFLVCDGYESPIAILQPLSSRTPKSHRHDAHDPTSDWNPRFAPRQVALAFYSKDDPLFNRRAKWLFCSSVAVVR